MLAAVLFLLVVIGNTAWQLRWSDEFDGNSLNTSLWNVAVNDSELPPTWNQVECYTANNVAVHDGALWLTARLENATCGGHSGFMYNVTSGKVDSRGKGNATFPLRIEVRSRLQNGWAYNQRQTDLLNDIKNHFKLFRHSANQSDGATKIPHPLFL